MTLKDKSIDFFCKGSLCDEEEFNYTRYSVSYNKNWKSFYLYAGSSNDDGTKFSFDEHNASVQLKQVARFSEKELKRIGMLVGLNINELHKAFLANGQAGLKEAIRDLHVA